MDPSKVINKIFRSKTTSPISSTNDTSITLIEIISTEELFDILEDINASIDVRALHSATIALNDLVHTKQALHTLARKFILHLASITEWLLAENVILKLELKQCKDVLKLIKEAKAVTQNK